MSSRKRVPRSHRLSTNVQWSHCPRKMDVVSPYGISVARMEHFNGIVMEKLHKFFEKNGHVLELSSALGALDLVYGNYASTKMRLK